MAAGFGRRSLLVGRCLVGFSRQFEPGEKWRRYGRRGRRAGAERTASALIVTRFAPSPTGDLHLGGVWVALASKAWARAHGGRYLVRVEDLDTPRVVPGSAERIADDLAWLDLASDEPVVWQSSRFPRYAAAVEELRARGFVYPCDCSRAEIARVASAPHAGEEAVYPGLCRDADPERAMKRAPAWRLRIPESAHVSFVDGLRGLVEQDVRSAVGDFVLQRADGVFAYQLAVSIDDAEMGITHVIRGDDLLGSTPRQILLQRLLGLRVPAYIHMPLVVAPDGERLAKRTAGATVRQLREAGVDARRIVDTLSRAIGLPGAPGTWRRDPWPIPQTW